MKPDLKKKIKNLLYGKSQQSIFLNRLFLSLNIFVLTLFIFEGVLSGVTFIRELEILIAVVFSLEYLARLYVSPKRLKYFFDIFSLADLVVIFSLFAPSIIGSVAILRVIRTLRIIAGYKLLNYASLKSNKIGNNKETYIAFLNLIVFLFIMTILVFSSQVNVNPKINSYLDALYFTVTTLTTTGFGDIIAEGNEGKILTILIMLFGITLFIRLAKSVFRGKRIYYTCPDCGLKSHDFDSIHCKHCGHIIKNEVLE